MAAGGRLSPATLQARDRVQIFVDSAEIADLHVLQDGPRHDLEKGAIEWRRHAVCRYRRRARRMGRYIWRASPTLGPLLETGGKLKRPWRNSKNSQNRTMSLRSMFAGYYAALGDRDRASSGWKEVTGSARRV